MSPEDYCKLFEDAPVALLKPIPLCAPLSTVEALLDAVRGQDHLRAHELTQEFLLQWCIPATQQLPDEIPTIAPPLLALRNPSLPRPLEPPTRS